MKVGRREGPYDIDSKYGNMNFRIKIAYYPTLPLEHHTKHDSQHFYVEEGYARATAG